VSREEIQRSLFGKVRKQRTLEAPVLKAAMDYLNSIRGCHVWRQNTGWKPWYDTNGKRHVVYYGQKGQGDITGLIRGVRIEVETKAEGEEPNEWQHAWMDMIRSYGGIAIWCDSIEMLQLKLAVEFEKRGWK
jgi:hypothetical protein